MKIRKLFVFLAAVVLSVCVLAFVACSEKFIGTWRYYVEEANLGLTLVIDEDGVGDAIIEGDGSWVDWAEEALTYPFTYEYDDGERRLTLTFDAYEGVKMSGYFDKEFTCFIMDYPDSNMVFYKI